MTAAAPPPLIGVWSGEHVTLTLTSSGGQLHEDCATSSFTGPIPLDGSSGFVATGSHESHSRGPTRLDDSERLAIHPVQLLGHFSGQLLDLDVHVAAGPVARYRLAPGSEFNRVPCLAHPLVGQ